MNLLVLQSDQLCPIFYKLILDAHMSLYALLGLSSLNLIVAENSSTTLSCIFSGTDVTVSWLAFIGTAPPIIFSTNATNFTINDFSESSDSGWYVCIASNILGAIVSNPVRLSVNGDLAPCKCHINFKLLHRMLFCGVGFSSTLTHQL